MNVNLSASSQELLLKAAAEKQISLEELASELLNEAIQNYLSGSVKSNHLPLMPEQPYAYYADPEEPAIPLEDWNIENEDRGIS
ncbi:hypothetical protein [Roseofilum sp. Guam]|uniref:hypothetical protein n=1 Tax=Roseofilum sp. Guam TaxID=2821502 RepID=UPI001B177E1E|nr:hypothetical protein [Roseofilum sp. Guam]MBP0026939.1 hypothetical protein [Roseofilum sp. Guam]